MEFLKKKLVLYYFYLKFGIVLFLLEFCDWRVLDEFIKKYIMYVLFLVKLGYNFIKCLLLRFILKEICVVGFWFFWGFFWGGVVFFWLLLLLFFVVFFKLLLNYLLKINYCLNYI